MSIYAWFKDLFSKSPGIYCLISSLQTTLASNIETAESWWDSNLQSPDRESDDLPLLLDDLINVDNNNIQYCIRYWVKIYIMI